MTKLVELAADLERYFDDRGWSFCFIGGLALQRWGQSRLTLDVDVTLLTGLGEEQSFIEPLLSRYQPRISDAARFAVLNRVLLLQTADGVGIDIALAWMPYEYRVVERSSKHRYAPKAFLRTCSAEDLVVLKGFADRPQDWVDIESVIVAQGPRLDRAYILENLSPLCEIKEAPEIITRLQKLFGEADPPQTD